MRQFVDEAAFLASLEQPAETDLTPVPVFVAPTKQDRGYLRRREAILAYTARQMEISTTVSQLQAKMTAYQERAAVVDGQVAALTVARDAAIGEERATAEQALAQAAAEQQAVVAEVLGVIDQTREAITTQQDQLFTAQMDLVVPYIRGIKYPQADGTVKVWARPYSREEQDEFDQEVRALLADASEETFTRMVSAITGAAGGQSTVPPAKAGR